MRKETIRNLLKNALKLDFTLRFTHMYSLKTRFVLYILRIRVRQKLDLYLIKTRFILCISRIRIRQKLNFTLRFTHLYSLKTTFVLYILAFVLVKN